MPCPSTIAYDACMGSLRDRVLPFLRHRNIRLNTDLGQHFLVEEEILDAILESARIGPEDHVVEIGPGIGILTSELVMKAREVTVIELDDRMIPLMKDFLPPKQKRTTKTFTVIVGNALSTPFPTTPYSVVANIPYHITSPLLRHAYLESPTAPTAMTLLIQREVAENICDTDHAGILTILVALFGTPSIVCNVPPEAFVPPPAVHSAVLRIVSHPQPLADRPTIDTVLRLLKLSFAGKRKMLRNTLGSMDGGMELMKKSGIDATRRPETLTVEEWKTLANGWIIDKTKK